MNRKLKAIVIITLSAVALFITYSVGLVSGEQVNRVTPADQKAFQACLDAEQPLRAQDGGSTLSGPCFEDTVLSWQR